MDMMKLTLDCLCDAFWIGAAVYFIKAMKALKKYIESEDDDDDADWWKKNSGGRN